MKIVYFSSHPHINMSAPSGPGTHIREIIHGFEHRGHEVIKMIAGGEKLSEVDSSIVFKKRSWKKWIPNIFWQTLKDFYMTRLDKKQEIELIALIKKEKPDFIYERTSYLMGAGYRAAQKTGIRYCCEMNAPYPEERIAMSGRSFYHERAQKNERNQILAAHRVFVVSSALKDYLLKKLHTNADKIIVTPNAVNPSHAKVEDIALNELRKKYGLQTTDKVIGFVGSIFPYHGVDALIEAFHEISKSGFNSIKLLIVGDGEILKDLKERTKELAIDNKVIFTGNVKHQLIYQHIALMDITVMARSNWYGSPVKIFEYGLMSKSIVAPDVIPVRDVMIDGEDGIFVQDNPDSLRSAIVQLLSNTIEASRMAENFHHKVTKRHTWQQVSDTILFEMK